MKSIKVLIVVVAAMGFAFSCADQKPQRYSIAESKAPEASLFRQNCAICHGPEAEGKKLGDGRIIPNIRDGEHKYATDDQIFDHISNGGNGMVPFRNMLTEREIKSLVRFVQDDLRKGDAKK